MTLVRVRAHLVKLFQQPLLIAADTPRGLRLPGLDITVRAPRHAVFQSRGNGLEQREHFIRLGVIHPHRIAR